MEKKQCKNISGGNTATCSEMFDCCDCGGNDCGCAYCWSCNACESCLNESDDDYQPRTETKQEG